MPVAMTQDATSPMELELDLEKEVERIQKTAEKQLATVNGLNISLVKKIRKSEAISASLLAQNKDLETNNADLVAQLERARDEVRTLSLKEARLAEVEDKLSQANSALVAAEVAVKKTEARYDGAVSDRDALEEELRTRQLTLDQTKQELESVTSQAKAEKEQLDATVNERGLALAAVEKERDEGVRARDEATQLVQTRDADLEKVNANVVLLAKEKEQAVQDGEARVKEVEDRLAVVTEEADTASKNLAEVKALHETALEEKAALEKEVEELTQLKEELEESVEKTEKDLLAAREELETVTSEKDDLKAALDAKSTEADEVNTRCLALGTERDELTTRKGELESAVEISQRDADESKAALEEKNHAFVALESERNLLKSEKDSLENDYTEARERSARLDKEKTGLEKRVVELEDIEKKLRLSIDGLENEKVALVAAHQKELHDQIMKKDEEFALQHAELRKELDSVVDKHAAIRRAEMERDERDFPETVEMAAPVAAGAGVGAAAGAAVALDEATETSVPSDEPVAMPTTANEESAMDRALALDTPSDIHGEPIADIDEPAAKALPAGDEMVMVREDVEDAADELEVPEAPVAPDATRLAPIAPSAVATPAPAVFPEESDLVPDAPMAPTGGPGEGDTSGIVSEEVMEEMVVDERETGDDDVLEEVDEEEPVDDKTAAETRNLAMGVKPEETTTPATGETKMSDKIVDGVSSAADKAGEKIGDVKDAAMGVGKNGVKFAAGTGTKATDTTTKVGATAGGAGKEGTKNATAAASGAAMEASAKTKKAAGSFWSKVTACCVAPSPTVGDDAGRTTSAAGAK